VTHRRRGHDAGEATNVTNVIWKAAADLFERSLSADLLPVRLLGVGATKLTRTPLRRATCSREFASQQAALDQTIDAIRTQFGSASIQRGSLVDDLDAADDS